MHGDNARPADWPELEWEVTGPNGEDLTDRVDRHEEKRIEEMCWDQYDEEQNEPSEYGPGNPDYEYDLARDREE